MREIKFRGKEVMTGEWVYGSHVQTGAGLHHIIPQNLIADVVLQWPVDESTVGQFTGLKDKNGKEVYEGDIIQLRGEEPLEVYFDCGGFMAGDGFLDDYWNMYGYMFEVVGNKFDNPDLLEDEE